MLMDGHHDSPLTKYTHTSCDIFVWESPSLSHHKFKYQIRTVYKLTR